MNLYFFPMKVNTLWALTAILAVMFSLNGHSQTSHQTSRKTTPGKHTYTAEWAKADSLADLGQPKSALVLVEKVYNAALAENNDPQVIKAIIYRIRLSSDFRENFMQNTIADLQKEIQSAKAPRKQVLLSILAEVYRKYYQNNQYRFRNRTNTSLNLPDSIETWDLTTLSGMITRTWLQSLEQVDTLKKIPIGRFDAILEQDIFDSGKKDKKRDDAAKFYPTLYDFLANRALDEFTTSDGGPRLAAQTFQVDQSWYFAPTQNFALNRMMIPADTTAPASLALRIFRDLALFHLQDADPRALIETELKRLAFVHEKYTRPGKDSLYLAALQQFEQSQQASPQSSSISYALATFLNNQAEQYNPLVSDQHQWDNRTALEVCDKAIRNFPDADGSKNCKILSASIREASLNITTSAATPVNKPSLALLGVKNLKQIYFRLIKLDPADKAERSDRLSIFKYLTSLPFAKSWSVNFPDQGDYQQHQAEIAIPGIPAGYWALLCSADKSFSSPKQVFAITNFWSTQISYISKRNNDGTNSYLLSDRESGLPLKGVRAEVWDRYYNYQTRSYAERIIATLTSDEQGRFEAPVPEQNLRNGARFLKLYAGDDQFNSDFFYQYPVYQQEERSVVQTQFYTDRAIYRPGQVVYFKGIITERTGEKTIPKTNQSTRVIFTDANGQKVSEQTLITGEFGSFNGSFTAPLGLLPGQMTISNENGSVSFSVEEYKRPTFEVTSDPLEGNYKLGELVSVTGKATAFAGNAIDGGQVTYRVVRAARFPFWNWRWCWPMPSSPEIEIAHGTVATQASGAYQFTFPAIPDVLVEKKSWPVFDYTITIDVTDLNGETQSAEQVVTVGYKAILIETKVPEKLSLEKDTVISFKTTNLNGRPTPASVRVTLKRLDQPGGIYRSRLWSRPDLHILTREEFASQFPNDLYDDESNPETWKGAETIFDKRLNTASDSLINLKKSGFTISRPGSYLMSFQTTDPYGEVVEVIKYVTIFSPASKEVPVNDICWFVPLKTSGQPGETARYLVGSKDENVNVWVEIRHADSLLSRQMIKLSNRAMVFEIPIKEQYRGNLSVDFVSIRHNRVFQHSEVVTVPLVSKKLGITFETFRNNLVPGSKERWKIRITNPDSKPARAELMATMYDASLDKFRLHDWSFYLYERILGMVPWETDAAFQTYSGQWYPVSQSDDIIIQHPGFRLNWFGTNYFNYGIRYARSAGGRMDKTMVMEDMAMPVSGVEVESKGAPQQVKFTPPAVVEDSVSSSSPHQKKETPPAGMQVRRDFRETAFFYPSLTTDSTGNLTLEFTAPESLTRWRMLGLATTKNLDWALIEKELVTKKELMVFPNAPRFVRQGDTVIFSAKIVNLSDHDLSGEVVLNLADGLTQQSFNNLIDAASSGAQGTQKQIFTVQKGKSIPISWQLIIPVNNAPAVLQYRVTATAGSFSDGEERTIPVLTNRMLVTESLPLPVRGKGSYDFSFEKLLKSGTNEVSTMKNHKLTLEFASNPAWYAVQAIPSLNDKKYDNAAAIFDAYWSNALASFIVNSNPKIKAVFEAWKNLTPDALKSNLEKNEELKSALLRETPWVMEAKSETARKQKLGLFFDPDNIKANLSDNLRKLIKLQSPNGGWTWFAGMPENRYITQEIVTGLGKLYHLGATDLLADPATQNMVTKAVFYLDGELQKDYENLKRYQAKNMNDNHLSSNQIQYLYARSFFMAGENKLVSEPTQNRMEAFTYFKKLAEKYWLQNDRQLQGMIALALSRLGNTTIPPLILKSLTEKALQSNEMGMYWAESDHGYFWYQAPVETQALMIEAYDEVGRDHAAVENLKIWLLKQKQTQEWRSSRATLEACYALLLRGTNLLADDPGVKISLGKEKINSENLGDIAKEAGTGYFQLSWSGKEITPEMGKITVSKSGDGVAWGAVYWQYFENLDKITPAATPMKLEKRLFLERMTSTGPVLDPLAGKPGASPVPVTLKTGDKVVVRIILTVDRNLEFVHMKDLRAAALEPVAPVSSGNSGRSEENGLSGYRYQDGLGYYQSTTDQATNFFFDYLPKGTYVFEYPLRVNGAGEYSNGIATIQCMYAPEFTAHSEGIRINVR